MKTNALTIVCLTAAGLLFLAGCEHENNRTSYRSSHKSPDNSCNTKQHEEPQARHADIVDTAVAAGSFKTLVTAVQEAGLVDTLKSPGPFTVFAPTDEAFAKLPHGTLERLLADKEQLRAVLLYHVVPGRVTASQVVKLHEAKTAQGSHLPIRTSHGTVQVGNARVLKTDVTASNGVIHVIDTVLIPPK